MFQRITASFLAVAVIAACLPFLNAIFLKNFPKSEFFRLPTALAAFRNAIFSLLLPYGIRLESTRPPLILLLGASLNQEANFIAEENFLSPSWPISLMNVSTVL